MRVELLESGENRLVLYMEPEGNKDQRNLQSMVNSDGDFLQGFGRDSSSGDVRHVQVIVQRNFTLPGCSD